MNKTDPYVQTDTNKLWNMFEDIRDILKRDEYVLYRTGTAIDKICIEGQQLIKEMESKENKNS